MPKQKSDLENILITGENIISNINIGWLVHDVPVRSHSDIVEITLHDFVENQNRENLLAK